MFGAFSNHSRARRRERRAMGLFSLRGQLRPSAHRLASGLFPLHRLLRFEPLEDRRLLANVTVSKLTDIVDGNTTSIVALIGSPGADGGISLREAVLAANANADADIINFGSLTGTIQLTNTGHVGEIQINRDLTISGPGASVLTVRAFDPTATLGDGARIFNIDDFLSFTTKTVAISGLTLTGGDVASSTGGGAILNLENLTVTNCTISGNSAGTATIGHRGGGIANVSGGNLTISGSTISGNTSKGSGGGIYSDLGSLTIVQSTISGNSTGSTNTGGGIYSRSSATIDSSTISANSADGGGGGIWQDAAAITITNSTISGNFARSFGGGIAAFAGMTVRHSTITLNRSDSDNSGGETGGGLFRGSGSTTIDHTIVAGNLRGTGSIRDDISGAVTAHYSLIGDNTGATITNNGGNQIGTGASPINALLGPLANDAGPTFTHALLTGSPAIDMGDPAAVAGVGNIPLSDQRGGQFTRVSGGRIDLGAFERQSFVVDTLADENDGNFTTGDFSLREAIGLVNAGSVGADTITFAASLTSGGPATILLTQGELAIAKSLTINGPGASLLTIDASGNDPTPAVNNGDGSRVFNLDDGNSNINKTTALSGLTLTGGDISTKGAGILSRETLTLTSCTISGNFAVGSVTDGGGIYSGNSLTTDAALTITNSTIIGNSAGSSGGGVFSKYSKSDVINSTISGNTAGARGGGIYSYLSDLTSTSITLSGNTASLDGGGIFSGSRGLLTVTSSTISGNTAGARGGGVFRNVTVGDLTVIQQSTITDNEASSGGGIHFQSDGAHSQSIEFRVADSTISRNRANQYGGGIYSVLNLGATLLVQRSTITLNRADADNSGTGSGGGIVNFGTYSSLSDTIVAGNLGSGSARDDFFGFVTASFSLIGVDTGATIISTGGTLIGTSTSPIDPRLAPLANNGGPTMTHALLGGSPAMDAGDPAAVAGAGGVPAFDQRGNPFGRVNDGDGAGGARIDMGAFESPPPPTLPADYNRNDVADAADYVLWRKTLSTAGLLPFAGADGNGNGVIDQPDYNVWRAHFGDTVPPPGAGSVAGEASSVQIQELRADAPAVSNIAADYIDESVVHIPIGKISAPAETDAVVARSASFAALETRSPGHDSSSRSRGPIHRFGVAGSGSDDLLLLAIDRVGRAVRPHALTSADVECNDLHVADAVEPSSVDAAFSQALGKWQLECGDASMARI